MKKMIVVLFCLVGSFVYFTFLCCSSTANVNNRPVWVNTVPSGCFVGISMIYPNEAQARSAAREDGIKQLIQYYGTTLNDKLKIYIGTHGDTGSTLISTMASEQFTELLTKGLAQSLSAREYYIEIQKNTVKKGYIAFALMQVDSSYLNRAAAGAAIEIGKKANLEPDAIKKIQMQRAAEFFSGNLSNVFDF